MSHMIWMLLTMALCVFMMQHLRGPGPWWAHVVRFSYAVTGVALSCVVLGWGAVAYVEEGLLLPFGMYAVALLLLRRRQTVWTQAGCAVIALGVLSMAIVVAMIAYGANAPAIA